MFGGRKTYRRKGRKACRRKGRTTRGRGRGCRGGQGDPQPRNLVGEIDIHDPRLDDPNWVYFN